MKDGFKDRLTDTEGFNEGPILGSKLSLGIADGLSDGFKVTV